MNNDSCRDPRLPIAIGDSLPTRRGQPKPAEYHACQARYFNGLLGLESRFTRFIHFEDYSVPDLCRIFDRFCRDSEYSLTSAACANAFVLFTAAYSQRDE